MNESESRQDGLSMAQGELRPVVEATRQYGATHPGAVEQIWFEDSPQRVVVLVGRDDVETHMTALRALVAAPEHVELKRSPWPAGHLERIREEIMESTRGSINEIGQGKGILDIGLWADQVELAASLHQRYGEAVVITVGYFPYPDIESGRAAAVASNQEPADLAALPHEVSLTLEEGIEIRSGSHVSSQLTIRNESTLDLVAGKLLPSVVDPTTGRVVGGYEGAITLELRRYHVPAGASQAIPVLIGTASTRPELGYAVPPGPWAIRMLLQLGDGGFQCMLPIDVLR